MRLICQKVDALGVLQLYKFSDERLLTGVSLNYRPRPEVDIRAGGRIPPIAVFSWVTSIVNFDELSSGGLSTPGAWFTSLERRFCCPAKQLSLAQ
jgi:hypothetical protein